MNRASVVKARRRLKAPRPPRHGNADNSRDHAYNAALAREKRKARRFFDVRLRRAGQLKGLPRAVWLVRAGPVAASCNATGTWRRLDRTLHD